MLATYATAVGTSDHLYPVWVPEAGTSNVDPAAAAGRVMRMVARTARMDGRAG